MSGTGRSYGGESQAERSARRHQQLLDAGLELFGTAGYRASTVRSICREAKVTDRYFYEHFAHTEDLLLAVYGVCIERLLSVTGEAVATGDGDVAATATAGLEAFFSEIQADRRLARVVWLEVLGVSARVEAAYLASVEAFGELVLTTVRSATTAYGVPHEEQAMLGTAIVGGLSQAAMTWVLEDFATERSTVVAALSRFVLGVAGNLD